MSQTARAGDVDQRALPQRAVDLNLEPPVRAAHQRRVGAATEHRPTV
jgi:hypothetical protein